MRRALTALALLLGLPLGVAACLWDRDTPAEEAKGMPEIVAVLTGRFERKPPLFYEMRLRRVTAEIETHPEDLAAYDDAGVACDRPGGAMTRSPGWRRSGRNWKARRLASGSERTPVPVSREPRHVPRSSLGAAGGDRTKIDEVKAARDEIAKAIEINPNVHFGRETYQLCGWSGSWTRRRWRTTISSRTSYGP